MKKSVALVLALVLLLSFVACKKSQKANADYGPAYEPVTDKNGVVQTTEDYIILTDKNGELVSRVVTQVAYDEESNSSIVEVVMPETSIIYHTLTYPSIPETTDKKDANKKTDKNDTTAAPAPGSTAKGETTAAPQITFAPGYTAFEDTRLNWPSAGFMQAIPVYSEKVADSVHTKDDNGEIVIIRLNDVSYAQYLKYIEKVKAAGFTTDRELPEKLEAGDTNTVVFYSKSHGLWTGIRYYPYNSPNRICDVDIVVSSYDPLKMIQQTETPSDKD